VAKDHEAENHAMVGKGFLFLCGALRPYITSELRHTFGAGWWKIGVLTTLPRRCSHEIV